jgi:hypothetical protein
MTDAVATTPSDNITLSQCDEYARFDNLNEDGEDNGDIDCNHIITKSQETRTRKKRIFSRISKGKKTPSPPPKKKSKRNAILIEDEGEGEKEIEENIIHNNNGESPLISPSQAASSSSNSSPNVSQKSYSSSSSLSSPSSSITHHSQLLNDSTSFSPSNRIIPNRPPNINESDYVLMDEDLDINNIIENEGEGEDEITHIPFVANNEDANSNDNYGVNDPPTPYDPAMEATREAIERRNREQLFNELEVIPPPVDMNAPDENLTEEQLKIRREYDPNKRSEYIFNNRAPFVRSGEYTGKDCHYIRHVYDDYDEETQNGEDAAQKIETLRKFDTIFKKVFPRGLNSAGDKSVLNETQDLLNAFGMDMSNFSLPEDQVENIYRDFIAQCFRVFFSMKDYGLMNSENDVKVRKILDRLNYGKIVLQNLYAFAACSYAGEIAPNIDQSESNYAMWRFRNRQSSELKENEMNSLQNLICFLLTKAHNMGYRRYRECMMTPIRTETGIPTGAWKEAMSFKAFINQITEDKISGDGMWFHLTRDSSNYDKAANYLTYSKDPEIPWLVPDRHIFSFKNGMYMIKDERFIPYTEFKTTFPYGPPTACNYFNIDVNYAPIKEMLDYMDIQTPAFEQILNTQNISADLKRWIYAMLVGRILYNVGELDDYQINVFLKGLANTGKSKILEDISNIYEKRDVGTLPNNIEEQFGLCNIADKYIAIADDVRKNIKLDQSDFQNMASGNTVSCPRKYKAPLIVYKWECGVLWSGNELPDFQDNAGSISRRFLVVLFNNFVTNVDMTLSARLNEELPLLIIKGNWAYRNMLRRYGSKKGIWEIVPREFKEQKQEVAASNNALMSYFTSGALRFGEEYYMTMDLLRDKVMEHAKNNSYTLPRWTTDYYRGPFGVYKLKYKVANKNWPRIQLNQANQNDPTYSIRMKRLHTSFAFGCELAINSSTDDIVAPAK